MIQSYDSVTAKIHMVPVDKKLWTNSWEPFAFYLFWADVYLLILTHFPQVPHICVGEMGGIGLGNRFSSVQCQTITWTNAALLSIGCLGTNVSEI